MWGTSSPGDKPTGDFGNEPDATSISDRGLFRLLAGNLSPGVFRLLQHNLPTTDIGSSPYFSAAPIALTRSSSVNGFKIIRKSFNSFRTSRSL
jgi:hypothetical protein